MDMIAPDTMAIFTAVQSSDQRVTINKRAKYASMIASNMLPQAADITDGYRLYPQIDPSLVHQLPSKIPASAKL